MKATSKSRPKGIHSLLREELANIFGLSPLSGLKRSKAVQLDSPQYQASWDPSSRINPMGRKHEIESDLTPEIDELDEKIMYGLQSAMQSQLSILAAAN